MTKEASYNTHHKVSQRSWPPSHTWMSKSPCTSSAEGQRIPRTTIILRLRTEPSVSCGSRRQGFFIRHIKNIRYSPDDSFRRTRRTISTKERLVRLRQRLRMKMREWMIPWGRFSTVTMISFNKLPRTCGGQAVVSQHFNGGVESLNVSAGWNRRCRM